MKKILFLSFAALLLLPAVSSCEKDPSDPKYLVNTRWADSGSTGGETWTETFYFGVDSKGTFVRYISGSSETVSFTYTYDPPTVAMTDSQGSVIRGAVDGKKMYVEQWDQTYIKQ